MMKNLLFLALILVFYRGYTQDTASVFWELSVNTAQSYISSGGVDGVEQTSSEAYIIRDYGGMETSQRVYSSGSGLGYWPNETEENLNRYCEFEIFPRNGISFQLTQIRMRIGNSGGSNDVRTSIYYSLDEFETAVKIADALELPNKDLMDVQINVADSLLIVENQNTIRVRVYPWLAGGVASGKYFNIRDVQLTGLTTGEIIPELAEVSTVGISKISTQTALFKGIATNDGGVSLDSMGLVLDTEPGVDTSKMCILVEPNVGAFEIMLSELTPGVTYYANAFAVNGAGVAYGNEITFTTLEHLSAPGVSTETISDLRPTGAVAHGTVFFDGGLDVSLSGFCYSTQVSPSVNDFVVDAGEGLGDFSAYLVNLESETTYYYRAFAENAEGRGYGEVKAFTTPVPEPDLNIVVDPNGSGDFATLQEAFDAVPFNYLGDINIFVKNGIYEEKVLLESGKINVHLLGENRDSTIIRWDDYSGKIVYGVTLGTSTSYTIAIDADDFIAQNITFQNTYNGSQAVALRVKGDRMIFQACKFLGYQDTYYTWGRGRVYHQDCYIEGTVDFIFGSSVAVFKNCTIKSLRNSPITAASTEEGYSFGYVFMDCKVSSTTHGNYLGRPWKPFAQTVFMNTEESAHLASSGWLEWSGTTNHLSCYYAEYNCFGEGFKPENRVSWSHQLTSEEAAAYTLENIFSKETAATPYYYDWMPDFEPVVVSIPDKFRASGKIIQSLYPNPASDQIKLQYNLNASSKVVVSIAGIDGTFSNTIETGMKESGMHECLINLNCFKPGVYMVKIMSDKIVEMRQIVIVR